MDKEEKRVIPFGKAERVGNYKLWRSKTKLTYTPTDEERARVREKSEGKSRAVSRSYDLEVINVSNLDVSWKVCIPQTSMMYSTITMAYADEDADRRGQFLTMLFGNFLTATTNSNVYVHDAFSFLLEMMQFPYMLLSEKEMVKRMTDGLKADGWDKKHQKEHIDKWVEHRKELYGLIDEKIQRFIEDYEADLKERRAKEAEAKKQLAQDEIAEQALDMLGKEDKSEV